jgi:hypothetical protein
MTLKYHSEKPLDFLFEGKSYEFTPLMDYFPARNING